MIVISSAGEIKLGAGASAGTSGQVLTSGGAGAAVSWTTISSTPTTNQVLSATAGAAADAVGTYAFLGRTSTTTITSGTNYAGSTFVFAAVRLNSGASWATAADTAVQGAWGSGTPSGTWKAMGAFVTTGNCPATVFLRVA